MHELAKREILEALRDQQVAWHDKDIAAWTDYFTEDSDFVTWRGIWWHSRSENESGHNSMPDLIRNQLHNYSLSVDDLSILEPTVALVHASWTWANFIESGHHPEDRSGLMTMVMIKKNDKWKIRALQNTRTDAE